MKADQGPPLSKSYPTPWRRSSSGAGQWVVLLAVLLPVALLIAWRIPISFPEGDFIINAQAVARTGHVSSSFTPDTYPYLAGTAYAGAGFRGFLLLQVVLYLLLASSVLWLLRILTQGARATLPIALILCCDPDLLLSIPKVWDTELTSLLLVVFSGVCLLVLGQLSRGRLLLIATLWGCGLSVRPNFALLILPVLSLLLISREKRWIFKAAAMACWAFAVLLLINRLTHGSFYVARNGPYNFFAGANPYTQPALLRLLNAESSVQPALSALGIQLGAQVDAAYDVARSIYMHGALLFIGHHPFSFLWLCVLKAFTLLRPDTKVHALLTLPGLVRLLTSLCVPLWLATVALAERLEPADRLVLILAASYVLPFLLTNADPRFRPPLDLLALAHAASLLVRRAQAFHAAPGKLVPATS